MKTQVQRLRARAAKMTDKELTATVQKLHKLDVAPFADLIGAPRQSVYKWLRGLAMSPGYRKLLEGMFVEWHVGIRRGAASR